MRSKEKKIAVIGLGYVGLPLAIEFAKKYKVIGFDIDLMRIKELANVNDKTKEADLNSLKRVIRLGKNKEEIGLTFSSDLKDLKQFNHYIITVPTPIKKSNIPDLKLLAKGKVRDIYDLNDNHLLIVTTDRLSAYDVVMSEPVPNKGRILTGISNFWFKMMEDIRVEIFG